jgi:TetR/AcrR family transcriptional regulator
MPARPSRSATSSRPRGRPVKANPDGQRHELLMVAGAHFARHGFEGASLRAIATEAGLAHGLIRHYFGTKEDLWEAAAGHLFGQMQAAMAAAVSSVDNDDPLKRMAAQLRATVRTSARIPHLAGFVMQAGLAGGPRFARLVERYLRPAYALSLQPFARLRDKGRTAQINPHFIFMLATNAAVGPFAQLANARALADMELTDPDTADAYADALIEVLTHGILRETAHERETSP